MKKLFLAIAAVAMVFATSCKKESVNGAEEPAGDNEFVCIIDQNATSQKAPAISDDMGTMAHIDGNNIVWWQVGDQIAYYGQEIKDGTAQDAAYHTLTCSATSDNKARFSDPNKRFGDGDHKAYYPASLVVNGVLTLPSTITLTADKNAAQLPMYGVGNGSHYLTFHNLCAVLKITVPAWVKTANRIEVSNTSMALNGTFTVNNNKAVMSKTTDLSAADTKLTVNGSFTPGNVIYVPVPEGTLSNFSIRFYDSNNSEIFSNEANTATFTANKVYNITLRDYVCFTAKEVTSNNKAKVTLGAWNITTSASFQYQTVINGDVSAWQALTVGTRNSNNNEVTSGTRVDLPNVGDKVYFRAGTNDNVYLAKQEYNQCHYFRINDGKCDVRGDLMYLLSQTLSTTTASDYCFSELFKNTINLLNADIRISATSLGSNCCQYLFSGNDENNPNSSDLQSVKIEIAASTVGDRCFKKMFYKADKLTSVIFLTPNLTTTTGTNWFENWFDNAGTDNSISSRTLAIDPKFTDLTTGIGLAIQQATSSRWTIIYNGGSGNGSVTNEQN